MMKKSTFLAAILATFFCVNALSQLQITNNGTIIMEKSATSIPLAGQTVRTREYLGFENGNYLFLVNNSKLLCKLDASLKKVTTEEVSKDAAILQKRAKNSALLSENLSDLSATIFAFSSDKKTQASVFSLIDQGGYQHSTITVRSAGNGEILWKTQIQPAFNNEYFGFIQAAVADGGEAVFLLAKSQVGAGKSVSNSKFHFLKIERSGIVSQTEENIQEADYKDVDMKILSNGNLFVGGFRFETLPVASGRTATNKRETVLKSFGFVFNGKNLTKINEHVSDFSLLIPRDIRNVNQIYNDVHHVSIKGIYETADGTVTMLGEEHSQANYYQNMKLSKVEYLFRNVFIDAFSLDGKHLKTSILYKAQSLTTKSEIPDNALPLSFDVLTFPNYIMLIYNDVYKRDLTNAPSPRKFSDNIASIMAVAATIENGEIAEKTMLINGKKEERAFVKLIEQNENYALVYTIENNLISGALMVEKISW